MAFFARQMESRFPSARTIWLEIKCTLKLQAEQGVLYPVSFALMSALHSTRNRHISTWPFSDHQCRANRPKLQEKIINRRKRRGVTHDKSVFSLIGSCFRNWMNRVGHRTRHLLHLRPLCTQGEIGTFRHGPVQTSNATQICNCKNVRSKKKVKYCRCAQITEGVGRNCTLCLLH